MRVLIVYCHPSRDSATRKICEAFVEGLSSVGIEYEISDLYAMDFKADMSAAEYERESAYNDTPDISEDVREQQCKIENADGIAFVYPVFWTEAPAKLVGWFQRVWTYGYAYGERRMKRLEKALFLVSMGGDAADPVRKEQIKAMETVMLGDRINDRAVVKQMVFFDKTSRDNGEDSEYCERLKNYTQCAFAMGRNFFSGK